MSIMDKLTGRAQDFKTVFLNSEEGQRVLADIYKMCGMNRQIHDPSNSDNTLYNAGAHRVGQGIQSILSQDENDIMKVIKQGGKREAPQQDLSYDPYNTTK